ncbi:hypothetical protein JIN77_00655 [Verrucomicrobiaceae bacterium R5-34]|nr:hypothetical protein [Verrucomicrobiaceae bacterium R5-34]
MTIQSSIALLLISITLPLISSCDQVDQLVNKFKTEEAKATISEEELAKSDAAAAKYLEILERVPAILSKVNGEKSAFHARKQLDEVAHEIDQVVLDLVELDGAPTTLLSTDLSAGSHSGSSNSSSDDGIMATRKTPTIAGAIHWHIREENQEAYKQRAMRVAQRIQSHIHRIAKATDRSPVAFDVVMDGVLTMASTRKNTGSSSYPGVSPMPEGWMPLGLSEE